MDGSRARQVSREGNSDPDAQLVHRARTGDRAAAGQLFDRYIATVRYHLYRITGATQDLDDLSQRVFLATWKALPSFREEALFSTWLTRITIQLALTYLRELKRRPPPLTLAAEPTDLGPGPHGATSTRQLFHLLHRCLDSMRPKHRVVILLHTVLGYTVPETAALTGDSQRAVKAQLLRARKALTASVARTPQLASWLEETRTRGGTP